MISVRGFINSLSYQTEFLAGEAGTEMPCRDVILLSDPKVWLQKTDDGEFKDTVVYMQTHVFPAYSSTFDLLLRFFKQSGVSGILYQGGKRSDFSKATLMLADHLGLPLVWMNASVNYSAVARQFYTTYVQHTQQTRQQIRRVRKRLEQAVKESFTLSAWMSTIERELSVTTTLALSDRNGSRLDAEWSKSDGQLRLRIPVQLLDRMFYLHLSPNEPCPLLQTDAEALWIDELGGVLSYQTAYFLLVEIPGVSSQSRWACSFESALYDTISRLPIIRIRDHSHTGPVDGEETLHGSLSVRRRLGIFPVNAVHSVGLLWIKGTGDALDKLKRSTRTSDRPYVYRTFSPSTLNIRDEVLMLCNDMRLSGLQSALTSCVPWQDWRGNEGVILYGFQSKHDETNRTDSRIRELVTQLEIRLQVSFRAYFYRQSLTGTTDPAELLRVARSMTEQSYSDFISVIEQSKSVQFAENSDDVINRILPKPSQGSSYDHALQVLQPLLGDKGGEPLLEALEAYLECGAKMQVAADKLYLHRNTLRYRLKRAERLLNISLDDDEARFTYQLAIRTWRLRNPSPLPNATR
ncbi:PucR family transcriptional regulator [Alicyclobacillus dauci]|uniref:Helix-turn-helix domain-containing protein n=1 Tax=Alicyclobacillus dauci TaxID=1475485 RepID=A0ABY6Z4M6_9BACL|nr:helix-turn-helix domain-containing protein [Alicyclobacillus dauci]WAH37151.1 helix-turn-helix domain-containing protein [Alicyclobacillus dauci]